MTTLTLTALTVGLVLLIDTTVWLVSYKRSADSGNWRVIDANINVIITNVALLAIAVVALAYRTAT